MNLTALFISRPVMTTLLMLLIVIGGAVSFSQLSVSDLPTIEAPEIEVRASYAGAAPEVMVKLVTAPLEKELVNVSGLKQLSSTTGRGTAHINLTFGLDGDLDKAAQEVQVALRRADGALPSDMEQRPFYSKQSSGREHILYLVMRSPEANVAVLREISDRYVEPRLSRIEGVAAVESFGSPYAIKIQLNPELMAARRLSFEQVIGAIRQQKGDLPLGIIKTGTRELALELPARFQEVKDFEEMVIAAGPIKLKEIATIEESSENSAEFHYVTKDDLNLALILGISKINGANTVAISQAIQAILPQIESELPHGVELKVWFDRAVWIDNSIGEVEWSLFFAFIFVVGVIFLSLGRFSDGVIPSIALPISLLATFIGMYALGYSLDILSLLALTLSVGFVVDDAIVVMENIVRHREMGKSPLKASLDGSKEISFTIVAMTLSLIAVFLPILLMGGIYGRLFREFSVTLSIAIIASGIVSLSLTPLLCSRLLKAQKSTRLQSIAEKYNGALCRWYSLTLRFALNCRKTVLLGALLCMIALFPLFKALPVELFPQEDRGFMAGMVILPKGVSSERARDFQAAIEEAIQTNDNVESFIDISRRDNQLFLIRLKPLGQRSGQESIMAELQEAFDAIPGIQGYLRSLQLINFDLDNTQGGRYKYLIRGADAEIVEKFATLLKINLQQHPEFPYVNSNIRQDAPKLVIDVDDEKLRQLAIHPREVQHLLQNAFAGGFVTTINRGDNRYRVYAELAPEYRQTIGALDMLQLKSADGRMIPLKAVARWREALTSPTIYHIDRLPTATVTFSLNPNLPPNLGMKKLEMISSALLPTGVTASLSGSAELIASAIKDSALLLLAATAVMYFALGVLYESFIHPLTILSSLPLAALGGVLTLLAFDEPLSLYSMMGLLLLIGIVKKNGIMIVDFANEARKNSSTTAEEAIYRGCLARFRPIMMTTIAAILGALPIAIGFGESGERRGLGLAIAGGLLFSQMLTLYVTPALYLTLEKAVTQFKGRKALLQKSN